ncbi:BlaI/MecI/CopY family transcriptional regulator [Halobellus captivus]|uniref:BlaI/MecI/CopY family transcriptional regulator n=1 Tax=Halobellus captivus TaxID=2592614 RepID=UPI000EFB20F9|nr:BlaI/MecI/CopY family transcriptional regulator [Halobellus captivus]
MTQWTQLGPREREVLSVLRRADAPLTARDLLDAVRSRGDEVAYTTVKRTVDRLVEKGLVERDAETHRGRTRHRYRFDVEAARDRLVPAFAEELRAVLGEPAAERLARAVRTERGGGDGGDADAPDARPRHDDY